MTLITNAPAPGSSGRAGAVGGGVLTSARTMMAGFTSGQKVMVALAVAGLVLAGFVVSKWAGTPTYAPLFNNLSSSDASAVVAALDASGTPYQLTAGNTVMVPQESVYRARLDTAALVKQSGDSSSLLDQQGITTSDAMQQVQIQRYLESELAKTVGAIDGVSAATVKLAIPQRDVFASDNALPTASVMVTMSGGGTLNSGQVTAIQALVASSVPKLTAESVTITDAQGNLLSSSDDTGVGMADGRASATRTFEDRLSASLQTMLNQVTGSGGNVVRVTADLNFDKVEGTSTKYTYPRTIPAITSNGSTETLNSTGASTAGGVVGPIVPGATAAPTGAPIPGATSAYNKTTRNDVNPVDSAVTKTFTAPGSVRRLSVAVLLDQKVAGTLNVGQVTNLVNGAAGINATRGDTVQVAAIPFSTTDATAAATDEAAAAAAASREAMFGMIRQGLLGLMVFLVLLLAFLSSRRSKKKAKAAALSSSEQDELMRTLRAGQNVLESGRTQPELEAANADGERNRIRQDVGELVDRQPDEVAALLRGWLADRREG